MTTAEEVTGVLLLDGWHNVHAGTFKIGRFDLDPAQVGFSFASRVGFVSGPMSSVLAVSRPTTMQDHAAS